MNRKRIIIFISILSIGIAAFIYLYNDHPLTLKLLNGSARILSPPIEVIISVNGQIQTKAKCFSMHTYFDGHQTDSLVLWLPDKSASFGREILMVNKSEAFVGMPNSSNIQYDLLLNRYLLQSESGSFNVPFSSVKWDKQDPELEIEGKTIKFMTPELASDLSRSRIEIIIQ